MSLARVHQKGMSAGTVIADALTWQPNDLKVDICTCNLHRGGATLGCFVQKDSCHDTNDMQFSVFCYNLDLVCLSAKITGPFDTVTFAPSWPVLTAVTIV